MLLLALRMVYGACPAESDATCRRLIRMRPLLPTLVMTQMMLIKESELAADRTSFKVRRGGWSVVRDDRHEFHESHRFLRIRFPPMIAKQHGGAWNVCILGLCAGFILFVGTQPVHLLALIATTARACKYSSDVELLWSLQCSVGILVPND